MKKPYRHSGCSPSRWHSTACHLGTGCQRRASRQDGHNLTRLLGWTALPKPNPSHCEVRRNPTESPPASHDALTGASWSHSAGTGQRRWCMSSRRTGWKKTEGQQIMLDWKCETFTFSSDKGRLNGFMPSRCSLNWAWCLPHSWGNYCERTNKTHLHSLTTFWSLDCHLIKLFLGGLNVFKTFRY